MRKKAELKEPLISIIIPCYNGEDFIQDSIGSVISQSHKNWELIVVDDGSKDRSREVIKEYINDKRIKLIENERNMGISKTKNKGLLMAKGEYIAFLDQDDIWMREKLEWQLGLFENDDIGVACCGMIFTDENMKSKGIFNGFDDVDQQELIKNLYLTPINSSSLMMIKRECLSQVGSFSEDLKGWDDYEFLMRVATKFRIKYIRMPLVKKRIHSKSAQRISTVRNEATKVSGRVSTLHPFLKAYERTKEVTVLLSESVELLTEGEKGLVRKKLKKAMRMKPLYLKTWVLYMISALPGQSPLKVIAIISAIINTMNRMKAKFFRLY
jgi:teichuronic acid biosynthesis glycosyltransferase TuaG